jgi:transposase
MPKKKYPIKLRDEEYLQLRQYVRVGGKAARRVNRARILLLADEQFTDEQIVETLGVSMATVYRIRKHYHEGGVDNALQEKPRSGAPAKIDGRMEATVTMLVCSDPPEGYGRWTLQLLADQLVEWKVIDSIALNTVRTVRKKTNSNLGKSSGGA